MNDLFDLADPEKRPPQDIARALELSGRFQKHFDGILGLNEKESGSQLQLLVLFGDREERRVWK